jgi:N-acetylglucosaminyl-diphospho-decaprenol L-rhamnosyltransferase
MSSSGASAVTVVIVSYRSAALTIACLRSLVAERSLPGFTLNVVVVDNASGDAPDIAAAIESEGWSPWVKLVVAPRNGGFAYGNNLGFAETYKQGLPDLHLLNPDTHIKPGAIQKLVEYLNAHPEVGIAGSSFENGDGSDWPFAFRFPSLMSEFEGGLNWGLATRLMNRWAVAQVMGPHAQPTDWGSGASMMIRRSLLDRIGGLDENYFLYFEETDFCWRSKRAGAPMWYVPESRVVHIGGQSTKVTERNVAPRRFPAYWFESRRRYFMRTGSLPRAILIDVVALFSNAIGSLKLTLQGRRARAVPHYLSDLWRHSVIHRKNRALAMAPQIPSGNIPGADSSSRSTRSSSTRDSH